MTGAPDDPPTRTRFRAALLMNPRSGGGKVSRFGLPELAERSGADVLLTGRGADAATLARGAVEQGAEVLGVAGGDGTVSAVAAVAAEAGLPLLVVPAGTRNHFARDLGLDLQHPAAALAALDGGEQVRVDLGSLAGRTFVNNVSFGAYAEALLSPTYREAKARALASAVGRSLRGPRGIAVEVDTPLGPIGTPRIVLVSNNPYDLATPFRLGRRVRIDRGVLGVVMVKPPPGARLPSPSRVLRELAKGRSAAEASGVFAWVAPSVTLRGDGTTVPAGVDGEAVPLRLPVTCTVRPGALTVLLPRDRPGFPPEPPERGTGRR